MKARPIPKKEHWIDRALNVQAYHIEMCKTQEQHGRYWTLEQTAASLNRSEGSINEDILIASWMKTHEEIIRQFEYRNDCVAFLRRKKREMNMTGFNS